MKDVHLLCRGACFATALILPVSGAADDHASDRSAVPGPGIHGVVLPQPQRHGLYGTGGTGGAAGPIASKFRRTWMRSK
jgi:hypothetical protein